MAVSSLKSLFVQTVIFVNVWWNWVEITGFFFLLRNFFSFLLVSGIWIENLPCSFIFFFLLCFSLSHLLPQPSSLSSAVTLTHTPLYRFLFCFFPMSSVSFSFPLLFSSLCLTSIFLIYILSRWTPSSLSLLYLPFTGHQVIGSYFLLAAPLSVHYSLLYIVLLSTSSPVINFFLLFFLYISPPTLRCCPDSSAGWCWRCSLPCLAVFKLTSTICRLCTEPHKRYKCPHTHTYADKMS